MTRSIADQTTAELGGERSVLVRQRRDHAELEQLIERYHAADDSTRDDLLQHAWRLVFPHAFAEEAVLWPALRASVEGGEELTARVEREHQRINELVAELDTTTPTAPGYRERLETAFALLRTDAREEEDDLLARLREVTDDAELVRLGRRWEAVRRTAPTRPHPVVSRRPPGNALAALPLSLLDRARDVMDRSGRARSGRVARGAMAASRGMGGMARRIEHLPPLRRGERTDTRRT